jgi:hypothetical protein
MIQLSWPFVMNIYALSVFGLMAFFWGAYLFFRRSQESHIEEKLALDMVVVGLFGGLVLGRLGMLISDWEVFASNPVRLLILREYPGIHLVFALMGTLGAIWLILGKKRDRFIDLLDMALTGIVGGWCWFLILRSALSGSIWDVVVGLMVFGLFVWLWRLEGEYRTFEWYRGNKNQARTGLISGLALVGIGLFSMILDGFVLSNSIGYSVLIILGVLLIYTRSGHNLTEDIRSLTKYGKK